MRSSGIRARRLLACQQSIHLCLCVIAVVVGVRVWGGGDDDIGRPIKRDTIDGAGRLQSCCRSGISRASRCRGCRSCVAGAGKRICSCRCCRRRAGIPSHISGQVGCDCSGGKIAAPIPSHNGIGRAGVCSSGCRVGYLPCRGDLRKFRISDGRTGGDVGIDDVGDGGGVHQGMERCRGDEVAVGEGFAFGESCHG